jgi:hypothetical protein
LEEVIAPLAGKKARQYRVIRLPNQNQLIALLLNDHSAALVRSSTASTSAFGCDRDALRRAARLHY